jgi:hypothetical protein
VLARQSGARHSQEMSNTTVNGQEETLRQLAPRWNHGMIAASIAVSLLGAFTSTQLYVPAPY